MTRTLENALRMEAVVKLIVEQISDCLSHGEHEIAMELTRIAGDAYGSIRLWENKSDPETAAVVQRVRQQAKVQFTVARERVWSGGEQ